MKLKISLTPLIILLLLFQGCIHHKTDDFKKKFSWSKKTIATNMMITSASYYKGYIFCRQFDSKLFILDTVFKKNELLTKKYAEFNVERLMSFHDTIFVSINNVLYFVDSTFNLSKYQNDYPFKYGYPDLEDNQYSVYSCGGGEWHGAVFFWDKKKNKVYSYPCTQVQQVVRFNEKYVVSNSVAHMDGFSNYLFIEDPTRLYELKEEQLRLHCNWYREIDSLEKKKDDEYYRNMPKGVQYFENPYGTVILNTFVYNDALYSISATDSATVLNIVRDNKLIPLDTLFNKRINFTNAKTNTNSSKFVTSYWAHLSGYNGDGKKVDRKISGLVYRNGQHIDFVEFITPTSISKD